MKIVFFRSLFVIGSLSADNVDSPDETLTATAADVHHD